MKRIAINVVLLLGSTAFSLVVGEAVLRVFVHSGDYLRAELMSDSVLGHRVEPFSSGHDAWGFRNRTVPPISDIVAVGDSMTYGNMAPANRSWPAWLSEITSRSVYNMGLGGYGPLQYWHLLDSRAVSLSPQTVVLGLYLGNDLSGAFGAAYNLPHWSHLRRAGFSAAARETEAHIDTNTVDLNVRTRTWLRKYSVTYALLRFSVGEWLRPLQLKYVGVTDQVVRVLDAKNRLVAAIDPSHPGPAVDLDRAATLEGLRLTIHALDAMHATCQKKGIRLVVVLIPTKLSVFAPYLDWAEQRELNSLLRRTIENESELRRKLVSHLESSEIVYVDPLEELRAVAMVAPIYSRSLDVHPLSEGYRVIAKSIAWSLDAL